MLGKTIVLATIATVTIAGVALAKGDTYPMLGRVISVTDTIRIQNCTGFVYPFDDADDWEVGDWCSCIMDTKGTANVADDKIIIIRYENVKEMQTW